MGECIPEIEQDAAGGGRLSVIECLLSREIFEQRRRPDIRDIKWAVITHVTPATACPKGRLPESLPCGKGATHEFCESRVQFPIVSDRRPGRAAAGVFIAAAPGSRLVNPLH